MFKRQKRKEISKDEKRLSDPVYNDLDGIPDGISDSLSDNIISFRESFGDSFDLVIKNSDVCGVNIAFVVLDGMYDNLLVADAVIKPIINMEFASSEPMSIYEYIRTHVTAECDLKEVITMKDAVELLLSGNILVFIDGVERCMALSVQGYPKRSVEQPESEVQEKGSHEGFVDMYKDNVTLVRRRLKSPYLRFETIVAGSLSHTTLCFCYHAKRADPKTVNDVRAKLQNIKIDIVPGAGAIRPFIDAKGISLFTSVGTTERPDVFAAKLSEGRVGVIVDGTPYALIVPYLFIEHFHSLDDYLTRPYYALNLRILKIISFFASVFLPGTFVAIGTFHQEIFPSDALSEIYSALIKTPFPMMIEALIIYFIYEIVREAGLRMPKVVGHAVSIVGAIVIGDAAVTAGLVSAPMLIVLAITVICSAVVFSLHQPAAVLRMLFIIIGGITGLYGIVLCFGIVTVELCSIESFGVPFTSPMAPFDSYGMRDFILFKGWKKYGKRFIRVGNLRGSENVGNRR